MKTMLKFGTVATFALATLFVANHASAMCKTSPGGIFCEYPPISRGCNNDGVCKSTGLTLEGYGWCGDCPCAHDTCAVGVALSSACEDKVWLAYGVCYYDPYCCNTYWDEQCVNEATAWGTAWGVGGGCHGNTNP